LSNIGERKLKHIKVGMSQKTIGKKHTNNINNHSNKQMRRKFDEFLERIFCGMKHQRNNSIKKSIEYRKEHCQSDEGKKQKHKKTTKKLKTTKV
jgi:low affinity Fe/Cu permease